MSLQNSVNLIGHVGSDPAVRYLDSGTPLATFTLATSEPYLDKNKKRIEHTEWHNIVAWDRLAKVIEQHLTKGTKIAVTGRLRTRSYEKDGQKLYRTEIQMDEFIFLSSPKGYQSPNNQSDLPDTPLQEFDDLPF